MKNYNNSYGTTGGTVATWENYKPSYESAVYNDFVLFMQIATSDYEYFSYSW